MDSDNMREIDAADSSQLYPRLSGSKNYSADGYDTTKPGEVRRASLGVSAAVNDQHERIQAYTNNSMGLVGTNIRQKLGKLRHPSTSRRQENNSDLQPRNSELHTSSGSQHHEKFDQMQGLREQNMQLKNKMAQLNLALDSAMTQQQSARSILPPTGRPPPQTFSPASQGTMNSSVSQDELSKQVEINRRLNDLLNQKDDEIGRLTEQVMTLEEDVTRLRNTSPVRSTKKMAVKSSPTNNLVKGYGAVTEIENKYLDLQRENKELQKEIKLLNRIQDRQGKALEKNVEEGYSEKQVSQVLADLRVCKEQNKRLKQQLTDSERLNKSSHVNMMRLEDAIKELKANAVEQKKLQAKSKQNERLNEASEKIDELMQANQYLNQAKVNAVNLSGKQRQQYARQMASLHHRIDYLTRVLQENGVEITE